MMTLTMWQTVEIMKLFGSGCNLPIKWVIMKGKDSTGKLSD